MIRLKFTKGDLLKQLQKRVTALQGERVSYTVRVPPILYFWYPQEFGAGRQLEPNSPGFEHPPSKIPGKKGLRPRAMIRKVLPAIRIIMEQDIRAAFGKVGIQPAAAVVALEHALPLAKELIAQSFARELPGTRNTGKLQGRTAADVWRALARIERNSSDPLSQNDIADANRDDQAGDDDGDDEE